MAATNVELTRTIIGAAMKVLSALRPGLDEKIYECALVIELRRRGLRCDQQKVHDVFYEGELVGRFIPDLIVANRVIVETKVVTAFNESHLAQVLGYLSITGLLTALLLNFRYGRLEIKRVSHSLDSADTRGANDTA